MNTNDLQIHAVSVGLREGKWRVCAVIGCPSFGMIINFK